MKLLFKLLTLTIFFSCGSNKGSYVNDIVSVSTDQNYLIKNVDIFNGKDSVLILNQDVRIVGGVIKSIVKTGSIKDKVESTIIDGTGKVLMPGLIDSHVHLSGSGSVPWAEVKPDIEYNLKAYLYAGITTVYDLGGLASSLNKLGDKIEKGEVIGPQIFNTHVPITVAGSHPIPLAKLTAPFPLNKMVDKFVPTISSVEEAKEIIEKYIEKEVDYVKIVCDQLPMGTPEMQYELMQALIDEVHRNSLKAIVHIGSSQNAVSAIRAGADVLAHGIYKTKLTDIDANIIAKSGVPIIYTIAGFENVHLISEGKFEASAFDSILLPHEILHPINGENGTEFKRTEVMQDFAKDVSENRRYWKYNFNKLRKFGAKIVVGTDSSLPGTYAGSTYYQELDMLKEYGMSNFEILLAATYLNSRLFLDVPDYGTVEHGKRADLLLLSSNPINDLNAVKNPIMIMVAGKVVERKK